MRKVPVAPLRVGRMGCQGRCAERYDVGSAVRRPRMTSPTLRTPTVPVGDALLGTGAAGRSADHGGRAVAELWTAAAALSAGGIRK
jgi:hypothetical protein